MMTHLPPINTDTVWAILNDELSDDIANQLVWQTLGYTYSPDGQTWSGAALAEPWKEKYPTPPNFIESRPATVLLTRSIPKENKQLLKTYLGFKGYSIDQLVPRLTRRATMANWLLHHLRSQGQI